MKRTYSILLSSVLVVCSVKSFADSTAFPLMPRLTLAGAFDNDGNHIVSGDGMVPLWGDASHIFYTDLQSKTSFDKSWLGSLGFGYRQTQESTSILGSYLFVDRSVTDLNQTFWTLSPGVESLGQIWDMRVNGYFPVKTHNEFVRQDWADNLGDYSRVTFAGHTQYDNLASLYEKASTGGDVEVGRTLPFIPHLSAYVGGYYFNMDKTLPDVTGAEARLHYVVSKYISVEAKDTYDNVLHNSLGLQVKFNVGGTSTSRIEDPIERNIGTFMQGQGTPTGKMVTLSNTPLVERNNIWFFNNNSNNLLGATLTPEDCTYEHPCANSTFNQSTIDEIGTIAPGANYYFTGGNYSADNNGQEILLSNGESLFGRTEDYKAPAAISNLPVFSGGFEISGSNNNYLFDHVNIQNTSIQDSTSARTAVSVDAGNQVTVNNSILLSSENDAAQDFAAIRSNSTVLNVFNSTIQAQGITTLNNDKAVAGILFNGGVLNVNNSAINVNGTGQAVVAGIAELSGEANIQHSSITINSEGIPAGTIAGGVYVAGGLFNANALTINAAGNNNQSVVGILALDSNGSIVANIQNSTVNINSVSDNSNAGGVAAVGVNSSSNTVQVNISHSDITMAGSVLSGGIMGGVGAVGNGTLNISNNSSIKLLNGGTFVFENGGGQATDDGTTVCNGNHANCNF